MIATIIESHLEDGLARLLSQYANRPVLQGILSCLLNEVQAFETAAFPVAAGRMLLDGTAVGAQLDGIGELVGLARNGLADAEYTVLLFGVIAQNNSNGTNEALLRIVLKIYQAERATIISPYSFGHNHRLASGCLGIEVGSPSVAANLYPLLVSIVQKSIGAAINLSWVSTFDATQSFALAGPQAGMGLGDNNVANSGGTLATLIYNNLVN